MAVFGAVISYAAVMASYIKLKISRSQLERPYKGPLRIAVAFAGTILALISQGAVFAVPEYRPSVLGVAFFIVIALIYFVLFSRKRLVAQAPEEEVALMVEAQKELVHS